MADNKLEEIIRGLLAVPGPEGSTLYGQGEALKGYATPLQGKQEDITAADLGKIDVRKNFGKQGGGENKLAKNIGTGLAQFMQSMGHGMVGKPIDISGETQGSSALGKRGWESYLGGAIGSKLGAGLIAGALGGGKAADAAAAGASPTYFNQSKDKTTEYMNMQNELLKIDPSAITEENRTNLFRQLVAKYPNYDSAIKNYFYPKELTDTESFRQDSVQGILAMKSGADRKEVFKRLLEQYPDKAQQIQELDIYY